MIFIESRKRKPENLHKDYPGAAILDLTSKSENSEFIVLSPFYPHGNIPIPFSEGKTASSVEGIWQGLKVFKDADIDYSCFTNDTMKDLKRSIRVNGEPLGHRKGVNGSELLNYFEARMLIYLPSYKWVLDNVPAAHQAVEKIKHAEEKGKDVLLDYNTNDNFRDLEKPLSHAGLVKLYIEGNYPDPEKGVNGYKPFTKEEAETYRKQQKENKKKHIDGGIQTDLFS